jgi:hypothetical protein
MNSLSLKRNFWTHGAHTPWTLLIFKRPGTPDPFTKNVLKGLPLQ